MIMMIKLAVLSYLQIHLLDTKNILIVICTQKSHRILMMMIKLVITRLPYMTLAGSNRYEYDDDETRDHMAS